MLTVCGPLIESHLRSFEARLGCRADKWSFRTPDDAEFNVPEENNGEKSPKRDRLDNVRSVNCNNGACLDTTS